MKLLRSGEAETFKACYHAGLCAFVAGAFLYNAAAFVLRRDRHLAINAAVYGAATVFEARKVRHHLVAR